MWWSRTIADTVYLTVSVAFLINPAEQNWCCLEKAISLHSYIIKSVWPTFSQQGFIKQKHKAVIRTAGNTHQSKKTNGIKWKSHLYYSTHFREMIWRDAAEPERRVHLHSFRWEFGAGCRSATDPFHKLCMCSCTCGNTYNTEENLPVPATVFVWPWCPANGLLLLHLLLLLLSSWPRPAGAPAGTAGNPHRPSPTPSSPTPDHQTRRTPTIEGEKKKVLLKKNDLKWQV